MRVEQIGVIYTDGTRIPEIKDWLKPYSSLCRIVTFTGLAQAVPVLSKFPCDMLIVADRFPEAQGVILLKGLRRLCPKAQFILLATEQTAIEELAAMARNDLNIHYFPQPWDKQTLLAHIEAGIGKEIPSFAMAMALDEDQALRISRTLETLIEETSALSIYLVTELGQVLDFKGSELAQIGEISSLLGGSFAALQQLGATMGEHAPSANLIQRQGEAEDLYALSVGHEALLVLRFAVGPTAPRIGTVAFYARQAVDKLAKILAENHTKPTRPYVSAGAEDTLKNELDRLFTIAENEPEPTTKSTDRLFTYAQALKKGLVSRGLVNRWGSGTLNQDELREGDAS